MKHQILDSFILMLLNCFLLTKKLLNNAYLSCNSYTLFKVKKCIVSLILAHLKLKEFFYCQKTSQINYIFNFSITNNVFRN